MEKQELRVWHGGLHQQPRRRQHRWFAICFVGAMILGFFKVASEYLPYRSQMQTTEGDANEFDWKKLYPSESLHWVDCYSKFRCARLEVPLDYAKPQEEKAILALVKYPSKYSIDDPKWRGPILYNPGGPGGSGVETVRKYGETFSKIIGDDYDHIGFDPRGVGLTEPKFSIFETEAERRLWDSQMPSSLNASDDRDIAKWIALAGVLGDLAKRRAFAAKYVSTAIVARDMLRITRAHGREKLLYWGFSYGTVLGATYASMFPDHVERLIIDGVDDSFDYYKGLWSDNLVDTDKALGNVLAACAASSKCALYSPGATAESLHARITVLFDKLHQSPLPVVMKTKEGALNYGLLDRQLARGALFQGLYKPRTDLLPFFEGIIAAESGDGQKLFIASGKSDSTFRCDCGSGGTYPFKYLAETEIAIACGDADSVPSDPQFLKNLLLSIANSSSFSDFWAISALCSGWKVKPVERFTGRLGGATSHPLLLIGNTADPVTPVRHAHMMSSHFDRSVVLTQNSTGHCSLSAPSTCTVKHVRGYFREGKLPLPGTVCEEDEPMYPIEGREEGGELLSGEEDLRALVKELSDSYEVPRYGLSV